MPARPLPHPDLTALSCSTSSFRTLFARSSRPELPIRLSPDRHILNAQVMPICPTSYPHPVKHSNTRPRSRIPTIHLDPPIAM